MRRIGLRALAALLTVWTSLACSPSASTERVVTLESEPAATAPSNEVALGYGRVVDPQGRPVSGATLELRHEGVALGRAVSSASGEFELRGTLVRVPYYPQFLLSVQAADAELALLHVCELPHAFKSDEATGVGPRGADLGDIKLSPTHALQVEITGAQGPLEVEAYALVSELSAFVPSGWNPVAKAGANGDGELLLRGLPAQWIQLSASDGANGVCEYVRIGDAKRVELQLNPLRTCDVRVIDSETGAPVADAELELDLIGSVPGHRPLPLRGDLSGFDDIYSASFDPLTARRWRGQGTLRTDSAGLARFTSLLPGAHYECTVRAEGYFRSGLHFYSRRVTLFPEEGLNKILLRPQHRVTLRWAIPSTPESPAPSDGAVISLQHYDEFDGPAAVAAVEGCMENGQLVVQDLLDADELRFVALAPDGRRARLYYSTPHRWPPDEPTNVSATAFAPPRSIEVTLREVDGRPAEGVLVSANDRFPRGTCTDALGVARIDDFFATSVRVLASHEFRSTYEQDLGTFDLADGDAVIEAVWVPPFRAEVAVTRAGRPGLPYGFECHPWPAFSDQHTGRLVFEFAEPPPSAGVPIRLSAPGYRTASANIVPVREDAVTPVPIDLELQYGALIYSQRPREVALIAQRLDPNGKAVGAPRELRSVQLDPQRFRHNDGLPWEVLLDAGAWQVVDTLSGASSDVFELSPDAPHADVALHPNPDIALRIQVSGAQARRLQLPLRIAATPTNYTPRDTNWWECHQAAEGLHVYDLQKAVWALWIDPGEGWAPVRVEAVEVGDNGATVGPREFTRGSSVRVRVAPTPTGLPRPISVHVDHKSYPQFSRSSSLSAVEEVVVAGLCAGAYSVRIYEMFAWQSAREHLVQVDGVNDVTIDWAP